MRTSVIEILIAVTLVCICVAAAMTEPFGTVAQYLVHAGQAVMMLVIIVVAIASLVTTDRRRATAIGFLVPVCIYSLAISDRRARVGEPVGLKPLIRLPTNELLSIGYEKISKKIAYDGDTLQEIDINSLTLEDRRKNTRMIFTSRPGRSGFMYFGHVAISLFLGFTGVIIARLIYSWDQTKRRTTG